ncbi:MAG: TfoX/Sxy family protein [Bauldia sp.]
MATDDALRTELRQALGGLDGIAEKPMSGGIQFVWKGRMLCGVMGDDLMLRIDKHRYDDWIVEDGAHPMVMAGQSSKGWILVPKTAVLGKPAVLRKWVDRAIEFVGTLKEK